MRVYLKVSHSRGSHFGFQELPPTTGKYYRYYEPMTAHSHIPGSNAYTYSFALEPETHQPSGSINMSTFSDFEYTPMNFWFTTSPAITAPATAPAAAVFNSPPPVPIGVSTIGLSVGGPTLDLKAPFPEPKFVVSPWMESSIEPDFDIKPLI